MKRNTPFFIVSLFVLVFTTSPGRVLADSHDFSDTEDTLLMFVGEDIEALTIASRREESAWQAPAVARVISREQMLEHGFTTLSEALSVMPGFYMAEKPWGTFPYLRGISNSTLFLYDTVPLDADSDKSVHQLDYNLSLASIKRIEIIRGPGSVLWGPDAFAGVVNVVPMSGRDLDGVESGITYNQREEGESFFLNLGKGEALWDAFLSVSGRSGYEDEDEVNLVRFWGEDASDRPVPPADRYGEDSPGRSGYLETSGIFSYRDFLRISGRITNNHHPYAVFDEENGSWLEKRDTSSAFVKIEAKRPIDMVSSLRFTGFYNVFSPEYQIIDRTFEVKEKTSYGELIYDRSFLTGRGLLTGGISYREKHVADAPVWQSYLPDFLGSVNTGLLPLLTEEEYRDSLWSFFGQYSHQTDKLKSWVGLRHDGHDKYEDNISFSSGISYNPTRKVIFKLLYGSAYRTPSSRQLYAEETPRQEKIETLEAQFAYNPGKKTSLSVVAFTSKVKDHVKEDPYAQLSLPNEQDIYGLELDGSLALTDSLQLTANLTLLDNNGPDETYHLLAASFIRPDGSVENIYEDIKSPYDTGPKTIFNLAAKWYPADGVSIVPVLRYAAQRKLIDARTGNIETTDPVWLVDLTATAKNFLNTDFDLQFAVRNLFDTRYETPATYELMEGEAFTFRLMLRTTW